MNIFSVLWFKIFKIIKRTNSTESNRTLVHEYGSIHDKARDRLE